MCAVRSMLLLVVTLWCCVTMVQSVIDTHNITVSWESRLAQDLLSRYQQQGRIARPKRNSSEQMLINFGIRIITIDLDEKTQTLTTSAWLRHKWYDEYLAWDPEEYGGIKHIILPQNSVWMPEDIALVNTAEADLDLRPVNLQVKHTGRVFYAPHAVYKSGCLVDLTNYPYDVQSCSLWIQSVSQYSWNLRLVPYSPTPLDLDTYLGSFKDAKDWDVVENRTDFVDTPRDHGAILMYSRRGALCFTLGLRRRLGFMAVLLLLPCVFLAMMIPIIFCLPTERPDRHMLAMSLFASFMVLLLILTQNVPPSAASVPLLGKYYCFNLLLIIIAIFVSVFVIFVNKRAETKQRPPKFLQLIFFNVLAYPLCLRVRASAVMMKRPGRKDPDEQKEPMVVMVDKPSQKQQSQTPSLFPNSQQLNGAHEDDKLNLMYEEIQRLKDQLQQQQNKGEGGPGQLYPQQWRLITLMLDRMCAIMFFSINLLAIILLLPRPE